MTCANASATKPFGAIDTPTQGGPASGSGLCQLRVGADAAAEDHPGRRVDDHGDGGWRPARDRWTTTMSVRTSRRCSRASRTPPGRMARSGFRVIDTTTLTNGLHTISWTVTDNQGVDRGHRQPVLHRVERARCGDAAVESAASSRSGCDRPDIATAPHDDTPVLARRGWDLEGPWRWYGVGGAGRAVVRGEEIDRFELALGAHAGAHYTGHLREGEALAPLPVGSQLDATTGEFTWAPGVGFVGRYDLVFVRWAGPRAVARHEVRVILAPKGSGHVGVQVAIDVPRSQQAVEQPFVLAGWAADLDAASGTGIDTLHVWAYPLDGRRAGVPRHAGARRRAAGCRGGARRSIPRRRLWARAPGAHPRHVRPRGVPLE